MGNNINWQQLAIDLKGSIDRIDERTKIKFDHIDKQFETIDESIKVIRKDIQEINESQLPKFVTKGALYACTMLVISAAGVIVTFG